MLQSYREKSSIQAMVDQKPKQYGTGYVKGCGWPVALWAEYVPFLVVVFPLPREP